MKETNDAHTNLVPTNLVPTNLVPTNLVNLAPTNLVNLAPTNDLANTNLAPTNEDLVEIKLMKGLGKLASDLFVGINGRSFLIQRGERVRVPRYVADFIEESVEQDDRATALMERGG